ncbi:MAG: FAD-dependent oxidoreductase [Clostridium sp.]|nr:FAD-dependent oxidoreductase [Clostridium sp.]
MVKLKVLEFANQVSRKKMGSKNGLTENDPEYKILAPVVTTEMAEVALSLKMLEPMSAKEVAPRCGKSVEKTAELLWDLAMAGVVVVNEIDGVDKYWYSTWIPGIMEMMVNNRENIEKHPEIAMAFEEYGRVRGGASVGSFPMGKGLMRVIPIEEAIEGESRRASYEEISTYLNENDLFSVTNCSCREAREIMGEGCGHLSKDMCIQIGFGAEYYIKTGRGRQITREEAFEIVKQAEDDGMIHQIPNIDGPGKTHAICNCCGCSCLALRSAGMFGNSDMVRSNYIAEIDEEKCVGCGECVDACNMNALKLGPSLCSKDTTLKVEKERETPRDTEWGPDRWDPNYRENKEVVTEEGSVPCKTECPAHISIPAYIKLASQGRYTEALALIKQENPFPAVCGRICPRSCESACTRGDIDDPIAIDDIKKFIAEQDLDKDVRYIPKVRKKYNNKVAIIGAGPAGLSCAYYLAIDGYDVTVYEKEEVLGGMLTFGIPSYRLQKDVINAEIDILKEMNVKFKTGVEVGKDITIEELRDEGVEAFYLAIGAQAGRKLNIEGENAKGVITGVDFLKDVNLNRHSELEGDVVVIGGGNVAIDVARTATRVGAETVNMYCLEAKNEMSALDEEIDEALEENISINNSWAPNKILTENGKVTGVELKKCVSIFDKDGKFNPKYDENDTKIVKADHVIVSIGQAISWGDMLKGSDAKLNPNNTIIADGFTYQTDQKDIFAGGDVTTGPKFAIDAIAAGKEGAILIHRFVHKGQSLTIGRNRKLYHSLDKDKYDYSGYDHMPRQKAKDIEKVKNQIEFVDTRGLLTEEQIKLETERCLGCGLVEIDEFKCVGCGVCTTRCKFDAITLVRPYDEASVEFMDLKPEVIKQVMKRKVKITTKKVKTSVKNIFK